MICRYCGKELLEGDKYCACCGEPVPKPPKSIDERYLNKRVSTARFWSVFCSVLLQLFCLVYMGPILGLIFGVAVFPVCIWGIIYGVRKRTLEELEENSHKTIIAKQFSLDKTSICPVCGSHDIKLYRKGYDYGVGYWGSTFGVKGSGYAGGFDANKTCCHCQNCGNDWETNYDYRTINK